MQRISFCFKTCLLSGLAILFFAQVQSQQLKAGATSLSPVLKVNVRQELQLGAFTQGSAGGTIRLQTDGTRTATGTVVPLNFGASYMPLVLEIEGPKGSIVSMLSEEVTVLTGSNGGRMRLKIAGSNPAMPFIITDDPPAKSIITIGAELIVGNSQESPPGNYSGSLNVSFVVE